METSQRVEDERPIVYLWIPQTFHEGSLNLVSNRRTSRKPVIECGSCMLTLYRSYSAKEWEQLVKSYTYIQYAVPCQNMECLVGVRLHLSLTLDSINNVNCKQLLLYAQTLERGKTYLIFWTSCIRIPGRPVHAPRLKISWQWIKGGDTWEKQILRHCLY